MVTTPTFADVEAAAARIEGVAHRTPVLHSRLVDELVGAEVLFKCENLQRVGAFKFRGAYNALSRLHAEQRRRGVVAFSSGNHAQAVALSGRLLGIPVAIVMPRDAPPAKVAATEGYGAEVVMYDRYAENREELGRALAQERGVALIPPYDHPDIIAGQGTAAKELFEEAGPLDALYVPLGGGGLLSGSLLSAGALAPDCRVYGVEPEAGDDGRRSLERGEIVRIDPPVTIADGAQTGFLGELTFEIIRRRVTAIVTATDPELIDAMRVLGTYMKLVVEPTGALGLAALRNGGMPDDLRGARIGVLISGGNIDMRGFAELLAR